MRTQQEHKDRLVAVVVTYNRLPQLEVTIDRLLESSEEILAALLVVNNASNDGTGEWLEKRQKLDPRLSVLSCATNLGGAGGFEVGFRHAMSELSPDWLVVMDDDARPDPDALARFHAVDRTQADAWAAAVYYPDGRICDINRPSINPFWCRSTFWKTLRGGGRRDGFHLRASDYAADTTQMIDGASFVGLFISREGIEKVGFPRGSLFIYGDDVLYTLELRKAGGTIIFDPLLKFDHDHKTLEGEDIRFRPLWKCYYHYRNLLIVYRMAAGWLFWPAIMIVIPKWLLRARTHGGVRKAYLGLLVRAVRDGIVRRTNVPHEKVLKWAAE